MKRYSAAQARQHFSDILDAAERGENVLIERRGTRFELTARARKASRRQKRAVIEIIDPAVAAGDWSWTMSRQGLRFTATRKRS